MTANDVYIRALALLDQYESDGSIDAEKTKFYFGKAPMLIDSLQRDVAKADGVRITESITALTDVLEVSDDTALNVLPMGLVSQFALSDSNADFYNEYYPQYLKLKREIRHDEEDIYDTRNTLSGMK